VQTNKLVIFAHGSGSSRLSPRNRYVAQFLQNKGFATLLFDLLTEKEDQNYEMRFDIELLAKRLVDATNWISQNLNSKSAIGYFGASTGAAAALIAATRFGSDRVRAIVSRGGRVDMAGPYLRKVVAPTLLIVGERDENVLELNRSALNALASSAKKLTIIPTATHLFEEPGTLDQVAKHATDWFEKYL
ncbi:MAG TPA: alpha/beta fold hydrolase, partial [Nitrososphaerales archaeon]|nr:alpha/beta fold hydrolase [Nitrososphaerales archaeon]